MNRIILAFVNLAFYVPLFLSVKAINWVFVFVAQTSYFFSIHFSLVPGVIGCLQALEAIKVASAIGEPLCGRMLLFDALSARIRIVSLFIFLFFIFFISLIKRRRKEPAW